MSGQVSARSGQPVTTGYPYSGVDTWTGLWDSWDAYELHFKLCGTWPTCKLPPHPSRLPAATPAATRVLARSAPAPELTGPPTAKELFIAAMVKAALRPGPASARELKGVSQ
jgi:hypothetical protein